jgi:hypothetical protein
VQAAAWGDAKAPAPALWPCASAWQRRVTFSDLSERISDGFPVGSVCQCARTRSARACSGVVFRDLLRRTSRLLCRRQRRIPASPSTRWRLRDLASLLQGAIGAPRGLGGWRRSMRGSFAERWYSFHRVELVGWPLRRAASLRVLRGLHKRHGRVDIVTSCQLSHERHVCVSRCASIAVWSTVGQVFSRCGCVRAVRRVAHPSRERRVHRRGS